MRHALLILLAMGCSRELEDTAFDDDTELGTEGEADTEADTDPALVRRADCGGIEPADVGPFAGRVTLTFDDGPSPGQTDAVMAYLDANNIPATFFVLGAQLEAPTTWDITEDIVSNPLFDLANHSFDHPNLARQPLAAVAEQVDDTDILIQGFGQDSVFFRFPFGASTCDTADLVRDRNLRVTGWHIDTADWCYANLGIPGVCLQSDYWRIPPEYESDMRAFILEQVARYDGGILLFHDIHPWTVDILPDVVQDLRDAGYTFTSLDDVQTWPNLNAGTPADLPYLGESCDITNDTCFYSEYFAYCEPTVDAPQAGVCVMPCEGLCPDRDGAATTFCAETFPGTGQCLSRASSLNGTCSDIPGTRSVEMARFVGQSGAAEATAVVCAP